MNPNLIHPDLWIAGQIAYEPNGLILNALTQEGESKEYGACTFRMSEKTIKFRIAKITPTKIGQFVTLWKRIGNGPIVPYDLADTADLFIVSVRSGEKLGQFIFPKEVLWQKGFVSQVGVGGKRAMRVYPPWDKPGSQQAKRTQAWQLLYFSEIQPLLDVQKIQKFMLK